MASRYGRNKKREARAAIASLVAELEQEKHRSSAAERRIARAKEDGASEILRLQHLEPAIRMMTAHLTERYGPKLMDAAVKLQASDRHARPQPIDFRAVFDEISVSMDVVTIEGVIPSLHYRMNIARY